MTTWNKQTFFVLSGSPKKDGSSPELKTEAEKQIPDTIEMICKTPAEPVTVKCWKCKEDLDGDLKEAFSEHACTKDHTSLIIDDGLIFPAGLHNPEEEFRGCVWSDEQTKFLLQLIKSDDEKKKPGSKQKYWSRLAFQLNAEFNSKFTPDQVMNKLKNMRKKFKAVKHKEIAGESSSSRKRNSGWYWMRDMEEICGDEISIPSPSAESNSGPLYVMDDEDKDDDPFATPPRSVSPDEEPQQKKRKKKSLDDVLEEALGGMERRHRERQQVATNILSSIKELISLLKK